MAYQQKRKFTPGLPSVLVVVFNKKNAVEMEPKLQKIASAVANGGYTPPFKRSPQQEDVCRDAVSKSLSIVAVAGSGKTTTLGEIIGSLPPCNLKTSTFHSAAFSGYRRWKPNVRVDAKKTWKIVDEIIPEAVAKEIGSFVVKLVGFAKQIGITYLVPDDLDAWWGIIDHHSLFLESGKVTQDEAIEYARKVLRRGIEIEDVVDFDDMLFMTLVKDVRLWQNDRVLLDEAQDTNPVQRALLKRMLTATGKLTAVGDPHQAIYGFRGADADSFYAIQREFGTTEMPLTFSFRCPQAVVRYAQQFVAHIEAHPEAPEGSVTFAKPAEVDWTNVDAALCRNTAPLIDQAYALIGRGIGCRVLGREIGQGLIKLIDKMKAKGIDQLEKKLGDWEEREIAKAVSKGQEDKAQNIEDKATCVRAIIAHLDENSRTIPELKRQIEALFDDEHNGGLVTLATVHKAKGLEWDRVAILRPDLMPSKWARQEWMKEQETNIQYVAATRAKRDLIIITPDQPA